MSVELAAYFERLITTKVLVPGAKLPPERELAQSMAVSRSSLREAMHELQAKHLVERKPGRGTIVCEPSREVTALIANLDAVEQREVHTAELRSVVEPRIAEFAAGRATPANILRMEDSLRQQSENLNPSESYRLDLEFHLLLAQAAQNPLLTGLLDVTSQWNSDVRQRSHATKAGRKISKSGHEKIYEAIAAHDTHAAREAMESHLNEVREMISKTKD